MDPFGHLYGRRNRPRYEQLPPSVKRVVEAVKAKALESDFTDVVELLEWFFNDAVRNAFFHSDYILFGDELRSREAWFVHEGVPGRSLKLAEAADLINRAMVFFSVFIALFEKHCRSYKADKQIRAVLVQRVTGSR